MQREKALNLRGRLRLDCSHNDVLSALSSAPPLIEHLYGFTDT
jgi:hypothetical protein